LIAAALIAAAAGFALWIGRCAAARLLLSRAKHRSLAGHPRWARRLARLVPRTTYDEALFFSIDGAPVETVAARRAAFEGLRASHAARYPRSVAATAALAPLVPDLDFTSRYRVPFQFSPYVMQHLGSASVLSASEGRCLVDLDGNRSFDLAGSYGVNLFGNDFYKGCIERGAQRVAALGPVLGALHPVVEYNVCRLRDISRLDAVSFHMSGTEAVMQAVRCSPELATPRRRGTPSRCPT
jgi:glutamate-1-semialdehyde 2,1-aminomutase